MYDQTLLKYLGTTYGRKAVEDWTREMVRPLKGKVEPERYGDYILPLVALKRVSDAFEDEVHGGTVRYHIPEGRNWEAIRARKEGLGAFIDETAEEIVWASEENFRLIDVIDRTDYTALDDETLRGLVEVLSHYRLGLGDVDPDLFGAIYESLRRLNGKTPPPLLWLNRLLCGLAFPQPGEWIMSTPTGYGGLLTGCYRELLERFGEMEDWTYKPTYRILQTQFFAEELGIRGVGNALANALFHGMEAQLTVAPSLSEPKWFDLVVAHEGPNTGWRRVEELIRYLWEDGRMVIVLDSNRVHSRGDWEIRKRLLDADLVEAAVDTPAGLVVKVNRAKQRPGEVFLAKAPGNLTRMGLGRLLGLAQRWDGEDGRAAIVGTEVIARNGYDLRPSRYLA